MNAKLKKFLIALFWIAIWALIAFLVASPYILAGPYDVLLKFAEYIVKPDFWITILFSLIHVVIAFAIACLLGCSLAVLSYRIKNVYDFIQAPMQFFKSAPIVCVIVLILTIFGVEFVDIIVVIIAVLPIYFFAIYEACQNRNLNILNLLSVHKIPKKIIWKTYEWPNTLPFFNQATQVSIGIAWKAAVTAQMIGALNYTIGQGVFNAKISLDSPQLLVWMICVILISWGLEKLILLIIKKSSSNTIKKTLSEISKYNLGPKNKVNNEYLVKLSNVSKSYKNKQVLKDINLEIMPKQRLSLTGLTGAGKTTLLKIILGLEKASAGDVSIKNFNPRTFSAVFQESSLIDALTIQQNIELASLNNIKQDQIKISPANMLPAELSGGMKRCAEIERAMLSDSKIVVMDEPFAGLDDSTKNQAIKYISENLNNRALILITHDKQDSKDLNCKEFSI